MALRNTIFGRKKVKIYADADVNAFIAITHIRSLYQTDALNYLIVSLKANLLWNKIYVGYPMIGGNAFAHSFNIKNPVNSDSANRLSYIGSGSGKHDNNGYQPRILSIAGHSGANTFFIPSVNMNINSQGFTTCLYSTSYSQNMWEMGCETSSTQRIHVATSNNTAPQFNCRINSANITNNVEVGATGIFTGQRISSTQGNLIYNKSIVRAPFATTGTLPDIPLYLGSLNLNGVIINSSTRVYNGFFVHEAFSNTEAIIYHTILETYQSMLGRKTW
jgi:hypothetical protein